MNMGLDIQGIAPELSLAVLAVLILIVDLLLKGKKKWPVGVLSLIGYIVVVIIILSMWSLHGNYMNNTVVVDQFARLFQLIVIFASILTVILSIFYLEREGYHYGEFYSLLTFIVLGMFIMISAADIIVFFLGLELLSLALYVLVGLFRTRRESNEAAIKYLIMGGFSSAFLLYGIAMVYGATGSTKLGTIALATTSAVNGSGSILLLIGMMLLIVGFAFKLAFVPFHMWTPDVYQGAPTTVTAFMSVAVKVAAYAALIRVITSGFWGMHQDWTRILQVLAVLTMTLGNIAAIRQTNIKRMLAYSSIAHAGYILIAVITLSSPKGAVLASSSIIYYLSVYLFMNFGAFTVAFLVAGSEDKNYNIESYKGLATKTPILSVFMAIFMFSLIGIPPLAGFMAKFQIFYSAIKTDFVVLAVIGVLNSVIAVYYYLRIVVYMYMSEDENKVPLPELNPVIMIVLAFLALALIITGLFPSILMDRIIPALSSW